MGLISVPYTFSAGAVIVASEHNSNFSTIYNEFNGSISNANISASAAIADTKLATISTAGKVNISALTVASQATGDLIYASSASAWARLAVGTSSQVLIGGATPSFGSVPLAAMPAGTVLQVVQGSSSAVDTTADNIPYDDSIPQNDEGEEEYSVSITPKATTNKLRIDVTGYVEGSTAGQHTCLSLFQDSTAGALAAGFHAQIGSGEINCITFTHWMDAGTISPTTFKVFYGTSSGTATINGAGGARKGGGVLVSTILITEIKV